MQPRSWQLVVWLLEDNRNTQKQTKRTHTAICMQTGCSTYAEVVVGLGCGGGREGAVEMRWMVCVDAMSGARTLQQKCIVAPPRQQHSRHNSPARSTTQPHQQHRLHRARREQPLASAASEKRRSERATQWQRLPWHHSATGGSCARERAYKAKALGDRADIAARHKSAWSHLSKHGNSQAILLARSKPHLATWQHTHMRRPDEADVHSSPSWSEGRHAHSALHRRDHCKSRATERGGGASPKHDRKTDAKSGPRLHRPPSKSPHGSATDSSPTYRKSTCCPMHLESLSLSLSLSLHLTHKAQTSPRAHVYTIVMNVSHNT